jgi:hypothetical protein
LGELTRASEIISAHIRRLAFPENWFEVHSKLEAEIDPETGAQIIDPETQTRRDTGIRAMMVQQHNDFGFLSRQDLSVKEGLHHGSYCAEVGIENMLGAQGPMVKGTKAPVWIAHSMWNCFPDDSKSAMASNLFYTGNMIIRSYQKYSSLQNVQGAGWNKKNIQRIEKPNKDKDIELVTWHGDIFMPRKGGDIFIPNVKLTIAQDYVIFYEVNPLPYSRIIYNGYERLDVRNPYYVSPLTKMSPTQKIATVLTNKYIDAVHLETEPPTVYDGNDSDLAAQGGPKIQPATNTPTKNLANFKIVEVASSGPALQGVQFHMQELQKGTGVDSIRSGMTASTEQTATEVERTHQGSQIRTVDFLDKHEKQGLRPWLYLQHEMNKVSLKDYEFYNPEMMQPDFEMASKSDLPKTINFEVVGSKGIMEEDQRQAKTMAVTKFLIEIGQGKDLNMQALEKQFFADAGNKNPGRFLNIADKESMAKNLQEAEQQLDEAMQQNEELQGEMQKLQSQEASRIKDIEAKKEIEEDKAMNQENEINLKHQAELKKIEAEKEVQEQKVRGELALKDKQMDLFHEETMFKEYVSAMAPQEEPEEEGPTDSDILVEKFGDMYKQFIEQYNQTKVMLPERDDRGFIKSVRVTPDKPKLDS